MVIWNCQSQYFSFALTSRTWDHNNSVALVSFISLALTGWIMFFPKCDPMYVISFESSISVFITKLR